MSGIVTGIYQAIKQPLSHLKEKISKLDQKTKDLAEAIFAGVLIFGLGAFVLGVGIQSHSPLPIFMGGTLLFTLAICAISFYRDG